MSNGCWSSFTNNKYIILLPFEKNFLSSSTNNCQLSWALLSPGLYYSINIPALQNWPICNTDMQSSVSFQSSGTQASLCRQTIAGPLTITVYRVIVKHFIFLQSKLKRYITIFIALLKSLIHRESISSSSYIGFQTFCFSCISVGKASWLTNRFKILFIFSTLNAYCRIYIVL